MARPESPSPEDIEREYFLPDYGVVVKATSPEGAAELAAKTDQPASPINEGTPNG